MSKLVMVTKGAADSPLLSLDEILGQMESKGVPPSSRRKRTDKKDEPFRLPPLSSVVQTLSKPSNSKDLAKGKSKDQQTDRSLHVGFVATGPPVVRAGTVRESDLTTTPVYLNNLVREIVTGYLPIVPLEEALANGYCDHCGRLFTDLGDALSPGPFMWLHRVDSTIAICDECYQEISGESQGILHTTMSVGSDEKLPIQELVLERDCCRHHSVENPGRDLEAPEETDKPPQSPFESRSANQELNLLSSPQKVAQVFHNFTVAPEKEKAYSMMISSPLPLSFLGTSVKPSNKECDFDQGLYYSKAEGKTLCGLHRKETDAQFERLSLVSPQFVSVAKEGVIVFELGMLMKDRPISRVVLPNWCYGEISRLGSDRSKGIETSWSMGKLLQEALYSFYRLDEESSVISPLAKGWGKLVSVNRIAYSENNLELLLEGVFSNLREWVPVLSFINHSTSVDDDDASSAGFPSTGDEPLEDILEEEHEENEVENEEENEKDEKDEKDGDIEDRKVVEKEEAHQSTIPEYLGGYFLVNINPDSQQFNRVATVVVDSHHRLGLNYHETLREPSVGTESFQPSSTTQALRVGASLESEILFKYLEREIQQGLAPSVVLKSLFEKVRGPEGGYWYG